MAADANSPSLPSWQSGTVAQWLVTVNHRRIGLLYAGTAGVFLLLGGLMALLMRIQLLGPSVGMVEQGTYLGMTTFHGVGMVFFFAVPLVLGLAQAIVPLMAGARSDAFPRLNAIGFWLFLFGALCVLLSPLASGDSARAGWASYPPGSALQGGNAQDLVLLGVILASVAMLISAVNLIATVRHKGAPGMRWVTLPVFARSVVVFAGGVLVAAPLTILGGALLLLAREWPGTFDFVLGGTDEAPTLASGWIWAFGQPLAYLLLVPALGIVGEIAGTFSRGRFRGGRTLVLATIGFSGLVVVAWLHHTYSAGTGNEPGTWLGIVALVALVPLLAAAAEIGRSGLASPAALREAPVQLALGAILVLVLGILSGIFLAIFANDRDLRGTAFVTAHAHYLLFGPVLFAALAGLVYWWPKLVGRLLDPKMVSGGATLLVGGFVGAFFFQFIVGDKGLARRAASYEGVDGIQVLQILSSIAAFATVLGALAIVGAVAVNRFSGRRAGNDPWRGDTLEWFTSSPPPAHNFDVLPEVRSARPLDDLRRKLGEQGAL